jgi:Xaa-Pro aminopeptidase
VKEYEMVGDLSAHLRSLGADDNFLLIAASRHHPAIRVPGDRLLDSGDVILGEISPSIEGDFSQICKTAVLGGVTDAQRECFEILVESLNAGLRAGKAGVTVSETVRAMNAPLVSRGFGDYCRQPYMRARGHGLGMGSRAPGDISADNEVVLESGMLFVLHPNQYLPGSGYLMVGGPVLVTETGLQPLGTRPPSIDPIPV